MCWAALSCERGWLVHCLLIERNKADSFEQRKHCKKELKLPEMTRKHWCRTSESAAETEVWVSATSWKVRCEWVKTELKLFLQSKFFANPSANLLSLPFRFCFQKNLSRPWNEKTDSEGSPRGLRRCFRLVGSGSEFVLLFLGVLFKKRQNNFQKVRLLLLPHVEQSNGVLWLTMQQN